MDPKLTLNKQLRGGMLRLASLNIPSFLGKPRTDGLSLRESFDQLHPLITLIMFFKMMSMSLLTPSIGSNMVKI